MCFIPVSVAPPVVSNRARRSRTAPDTLRIDLVSPEKFDEQSKALTKPHAPRRRLPPSLSSWESDFALISDEPDMASSTNDATLNDEALALALQDDVGGRSKRNASFHARNAKNHDRLSESDEFYARALQEAEFQAAATNLSDVSRSFGFMDTPRQSAVVNAESFFRSSSRRRRSRGWDGIPTEGHQIRLDSYEDLLKLDEINGVVKKGLNQAQIRSLPLVSFSKGERTEDECRCCICYEDFIAGEKVMLLPCLHAYHSTCLVPWLSNNRICPICREEIKL